jgi:metallo-beta-lactamase family protein
LPGSAAIYLSITENNTGTRLLFSGDIGRFRSSILCAPAEFPQTDYIIMESTYGDKLHEPVFSTTDYLLKVIRKTCVEQKGQLIIPAFSIGRTQELLYHLNQLSLEKRLPDIPVIVDSPLSMAATAIYKKYTAYFNETLQKIMSVDDDPFDFAGLKFTQSVADSKEVARYDGPCIVIAASGMADAGRIRHHIAATIESSINTILLAGYCTPSSLGGQLQNAPKTIAINGKDYDVRATVESMHSMSAHGDTSDLLRFLNCQDASLVKSIFLVHGEYDSQVNFREKLLSKGFGKVIIPNLHESVEIATGVVA